MLGLEDEGLLLLRRPSPNLPSESVTFKRFEDGKRKSIQVTHIELLHGLETINVGELRGLHVRLDTPVPVQAATNEDFLESWIESKEITAKQQYLSYAKDFIGFLDRPLSGAMITNEDLEGYLEALRARELAPTTVTYAHAVIRSLLRFGAEQEAFEVDIDFGDSPSAEREALIKLRSKLSAGNMLVVLMDSLKIGYLVNEKIAADFPIRKSVMLDTQNLIQPKFYKELRDACYEMKSSKLDAILVKLRDKEHTQVYLIAAKIVDVRGLNITP
nr:phage integrase N-terminal SAM-like domain-containing protein [Leptolyngbya sp. FACHB-541]